MKSLRYFTFGILLFAIFLKINAVPASGVPVPLSGKLDERRIDSLYRLISPDASRPSFDVFYAAVKGYRGLAEEGRLKNTQFLTLIDFSLSSKQRRLWVIDLHNMNIVHHSLVAHGRNTGEEYAVKFSNVPHSNMSSLGFFVTGNTYYGKHGLSLIIEGMEKGINDNARKRAIVIHPAEYATWDFIKKYGRLGRSFGCPALPPAKSAPIIDTIKGSTCLFIFYKDKNYLVSSKYINQI